MPDSPNYTHAQDAALEAALVQLIVHRGPLKWAEMQKATGCMHNHLDRVLALLKKEAKIRYWRGTRNRSGWVLS